MAGRGAGARRKGHQFERDIANYLTDSTGFTWKRGLGQSRGGGGECADVELEDSDYSEKAAGIHFELKRHKRCNIKGALRQAMGDKRESDFPVIITKDDREPVLVTMLMEDWIDFFNAYLRDSSAEE